MLFLLPQSLFQCVSIGFVHFIRDVFADPRSAFIQLQRSIFLWDLLHAYQDLHPAPQTPAMAGKLLHGDENGTNVRNGCCPEQKLDAAFVQRTEEYK